MTINKDKYKITGFAQYTHMLYFTPRLKVRIVNEPSTSQYKPLVLKILTTYIVRYVQVIQFKRLAQIY